MKEVIDGLVRYLVCHARLFEAREAGFVFDRKAPYGVHTNDEYGNIGHVYLALYLTKHPANPYYRRSEALAMFSRAVGAWLRDGRRCLKAGEPLDFDEWPAFVMCRGLELTGGRLDAALRRDMADMVERFVRQVLPRPFFFTAPNHEMWKLVDIAVAGRVLGQSEWTRHAEFQTRQLIAYQTAEGFWEEGRHHGPSMQYGSHMLAGLALVAEATGSVAIRASAARQARFLARWSMPDGVTVGALDGRRCSALGAVVPGFELIPEGLTYMQRCVRSWERGGWLDPARKNAPVYRRPFHGDFISAEALLYFAALKPARSQRRSAPLSLDRSGRAAENHTPHFDAATVRRGPWAVMLSSQLSDVPKDTQFLYRLERQNRIEIWHELSSVVIGGGHNLITAPYPLYNAWVDSGFVQEPKGYSSLGGDAGAPAMARRRSMYYPRAASSGCRGRGAWLELDFAHAAIRFECAPRRDALTVAYRYRAMGAREIRVALAMMLWETASVRVNGRELPRTPQPVDIATSGDVVVECPLYGSRNILTVPKQGCSRVLFPLNLMEEYQAPAEQERMRSPFAIAFVETVLTDPGERGSGEWTVRVEVIP